MKYEGEIRRGNTKGKDSALSGYRDDGRGMTMLSDFTAGMKI